MPQIDNNVNKNKGVILLNKRYLKTKLILIFLSFLAAVLVLSVIIVVCTKTNDDLDPPNNLNTENPTEVLNTANFTNVEEVPNITIMPVNLNKLKVIQRTKWSNRASASMNVVTSPFSYVIIAHTVTPNCFTQESCIKRIINIQQYHMDILDFPDIGYNFLVGGDGSVFEGVGWDYVGAHTAGFNSLGFGIALIGDFQAILPTQVQLDATKSLIQLSVDLHKIKKDYKLCAHRHFFSTLSPGEMLFQEIQKWPHFMY